MLVRLEVVGDHVAAEPPHDPGQNGTDPPGADHAYGLPVEVETHQPVEGEVRFAHAVVGAVDFPVQGQNQADRVLRDGVRRVLGHANHRQVQPRRRRKVDVVVTGRAECHEPQAVPVEDIQRFGVQAVVDEGTHGPEAGRKRCRMASEPRLEKCDLVLVPLVRDPKRLALETVCVEDGDSHRSVLYGGVEVDREERFADSLQANRAPGKRPATQVQTVP